MTTTTNDSATGFDNMVSRNISTLPFKQLDEGWHDVEIKYVLRTNDHYIGLRSPQLKKSDKLPAWLDPTKQIAVYFLAPNNYGIVNRFPENGFWKYDEVLKLNPAKAAECVRMGDQGYAVRKDTKMRMISQDKTDSCQLIFLRMMTAAGLPEGIEGIDNICQALKGLKLKIKVTKHEYDGIEHYDVKSFVSCDTPEAELDRIPDPKAPVVLLPETE